MYTYYVSGAKHKYICIHTMSPELSINIYVCIHTVSLWLHMFHGPCVCSAFLRLAWFRFPWIGFWLAELMAYGGKFTLLTHALETCCQPYIVPALAVETCGFMELYTSSIIMLYKDSLYMYNKYRTYVPYVQTVRTFCTYCTNCTCASCPCKYVQCVYRTIEKKVEICLQNTQIPQT
jgi:hypothetical protein